MAGPWVLHFAICPPRKMVSYQLPTRLISKNATLRRQSLLIGLVAEIDKALTQDLRSRDRMYAFGGGTCPATHVDRSRRASRTLHFGPSVGPWPGVRPCLIDNGGGVAISI
jgi:hypothetical protein